MASANDSTYKEIFIDPLRKQLNEFAERMKVKDIHITEEEYQENAQAALQLFIAERDEHRVQSVYEQRYQEAMMDPTGQDLDDFHGGCCG
jgi:hypothetical protein